MTKRPALTITADILHDDRAILYVLSYPIMEPLLKDTQKDRNKMI
jgi:hypothetical protein